MLAMFCTCMYCSSSIACFIASVNGVNLERFLWLVVSFIFLTDDKLLFVVALRGV